MTTIYQRLLSYETDSTSPGDGRRVIRDERMRLHVAIERGDAEEIAERSTEAARVLAMWQALGVAE